MVDPHVARYLRQPYARVLVPDDDGRYAAQVLEFPGCFAEGASPEEAYGNLEEAAEAWVESALDQGFPVPEPFAMQGYSGTISLRLPKSLHRRAAQFAHRDGASLNQFLVAAIAHRLGMEDLGAAIASRLDDRLERLQVIEWVPVEGVLRRIPVAATGGTRTSVGIQDWEQESAALPPKREFLTEGED